uniref:RING-type domain-containing protein n=3 Tax=Phaseolus vulgaris TaxID=3885 RepID=V7CPY8_PHAVU|nr:hypothetical protein PHAVU_002G227800g [Phaseolus vulgaris]ESW31310.1 hypothetical protein PHAVU_002G227800g [Phaseolus vulgaris]
MWKCNHSHEKRVCGAKASYQNMKEEYKPKCGRKSRYMLCYLGEGVDAYTCPDNPTFLAFKNSIEATRSTLFLSLLSLLSSLHSVTLTETRDRNIAQKGFIHQTNFTLRFFFHFTNFAFFLVFSGVIAAMYVASMRKSFKDSLKVLEADIQHANTLASDFPREYDGACLQMRMSYSPAAHLFLFLVQWTDCNLAGALGLLRILIYKVYVDGTTTMSTHERKASIREFYAVIYPSLLQLQKGITDTEDKKQKAVCMERYRRRDDEDYRQCSDIDIEREDECGICMDMNTKIVLPNCNHAMCLKCYREWRTISQSCPFCRDSLKRVNSGDLWVFTDRRDVVDMATVTRENLRRVFMYIDKLPLIVPDSLFDAYDSHVR